MSCRDEHPEKEPPCLTITDEDGSERCLLPNATLKWQEKQYTVLYPCDPDTRKITDENRFFVQDEDGKLDAIDMKEIFSELDRLLSPEA